jgi:hypothetical protein
MDGIIERISALPVRFGGVEHSGWLPPGAAKPLPTPIEDVLLDLDIVEEDDGFLLCWSSGDGRHKGDRWFERIEDARREAAEAFGAEQSLWQNVRTPT